MHLDLHATDEQLAAIAKTENRKARITNLALGAILVALTAGVGYWIYREIANERIREARLNTAGQRIAATLDNEYTQVRQKYGGVRYNVTYSFEYADQTYRGSGTIAERPRSDRVTIIYDPVNPNTNRIEGESQFESTWPEKLILLAFVYLCYGVALVYRKIKSRRRVKRATNPPTV